MSEVQTHPEVTITNTGSHKDRVWSSWTYRDWNRIGTTVSPQMMPRVTGWAESDEYDLTAIPSRWDPRLAAAIVGVVHELTPATVYLDVNLLVHGLNRAISEIVVMLGLEPKPRLVARVLDAAELVGQLRDWTGMPAGDLADLLQVSRRSLYHWMRVGQASSPNLEKLQEFVNALRPVARKWRPSRVRVWLSSGEPSPSDLLQRRDFAEFARRAHDALAVGEIPLLPARRLEETVSGVFPEPLARLTRVQRVQALHSFSQEPLRRPRPAKWVPPELTDSDEEDD